MASLKVSPCVAALWTAMEAGNDVAAETAARRCLASMNDRAALEGAVLQMARQLSSSELKQADALRVIVRELEGALSMPVEGAAGAAAPEAAGTILLATLPGDRHDVGRHVWRMLLRRRGFDVKDLAMRAPALIARHAATTTTAICIHVFDRRVQPAVQSLVSHLLRRSHGASDASLPLLLGGPGVDEAFAQWVAIPEGGTPYWGGVYYCEDGAEMLQVLKQIVLFEPPPVTHAHAPSSDVSAEACASCGGCPLAAGCELASEI